MAGTYRRDGFLHNDTEMRCRISKATQLSVARPCHHDSEDQRTNSRGLAQPELPTRPQLAVKIPKCAVATARVRVCCGEQRRWRERNQGRMESQIKRPAPLRPFIILFTISSRLKISCFSAISRQDAYLRTDPCGYFDFGFCCTDYPVQVRGQEHLVRFCWLRKLWADSVSLPRHW